MRLANDGNPNYEICSRIRKDKVRMWELHCYVIIHRELSTTLKHSVFKSVSVLYLTSQGSSLGPLLFALYVNDLPQASNLTPTLFADDTLLTISCANSTNLQYGVNSELQKVDEWMRYKLSIYYSKTTYMLINSNSSQSCNFEVKINDSEIKHTTCTKYLGVYIDQYLFWTEHIHNHEIKLSRSIAMFYRIRYYLSTVIMHWDQFTTV